MKALLLGARNQDTASGRRGSRLHMIVALCMLVAMVHLTVIPSAWAQTKEEGSSDSTTSQFMMGAGVFFGNLLYMPAKFTYAVLGGVVGALAYPLSGMDDKVAKRIWDSSLRGTYALTPDHFRGDKPVRFLGVPQEEEDANASASPPPPATVSPR